MRILMLFCCMYFAANYSVDVSPSCYRAIQGVNHDVPRLYYYCYGAFQSCAHCAPDKKPSDVCKDILAHQPSERIGATYAGPAYYIDMLLAPQYQRMDNALDAKAQELGDRKQAWNWFAGAYFRDSVLTTAATMHKYQLILIDKNARERR